MSQNGSKCVFPKIPLDYLACTNKWNEPIFFSLGLNKFKECNVSSQATAWFKK